MSFADFWNILKEAQFTFTGIIEWVVALYHSVIENADIAPIWQYITTFFNTYLLPVCAVLSVLLLAVAFFGQKMSGVLKFTLFFIIGFFVGVRYLSPVIPENVFVPAWAVGAVVAIVIAVFYRFMFYILMTASVGYSVYRICYTGFSIKEATQYTAGKALVSLAVALVLVVIVLVFIKWAERLLTAFFGSWLAVIVFNKGVWSFTSLSFLVGRENTAVLVVSGVIALIGFIVQVKKRHVY